MEIKNVVLYARVDYEFISSMDRMLKNKKGSLNDSLTVTDVLPYELFF